MKKMKKCIHCKKSVKSCYNFCGWRCQVADAKAHGGKVHCPNGLPIRSICHDYTMIECEHGDHKDYKFPVMAYRVDGDKETHAVIYFDDCAVLTLCECRYWLWQIDNGSCIFSPMKDGRYNWYLSPESILEMKDGRYNWYLSPESILEIKDRMKK